MNYRLFLRNGSTWDGHDERLSDEICEEIGDTENMPGLPPGWTWLAGLYVEVAQVVAFATLPDLKGTGTK